MFRLLVPVLVLLGALGVTILSDRPQPPADFTYINRGDVNTLDLQKMSWTQDLRVARLLFEGLVMNDIFTHEMTIRPGAAESWDVLEDGRVFVFHLRQDGKWSNGEPLTAHDFVYTWRRGLLPDIASDYIVFFALIEGGQEFYDWRQAQLDAFDPKKDDAVELWEETKRRFDETVGLKAVNDHTLRVELVHPVPYFLDLTAFGVMYPVYPPLVRQYEQPDPETGRLDVRSGWTKPDRLVCNGPFTLELWRFKRDMRFEKNPLFWNKDQIYIDTISVPSVEDPNAQVLAFDTGAIHWLSDVTPSYRGDMLIAKQRFYDENREEYERLKALGLDQIEIDRQLPDDPRKNVHALPAFGTYFYNFNCSPRLPDGRDNPFADARVRRAFAMAIDKERVTRDVRRLGEPVATTLIPPGSIGGYDSPEGLPFDPVRARQELASAGYEGGRGFITVEILFNKDSGHDVIAQAISKDWQEHLGVNVTLQQKEIKVFRNELKAHNFMTSRAGWYGDYGDPTTFLDINKTGDGNNDRAYSNAEYDDILNRAGAERDPQKRMDILEAAEVMLVDHEVPLIPLFHYSNICMFDPDRITGITAHPRQQQDLYLLDVFGDGKGTDTPRMLPPRAASAGGARTVESRSGADDDRAAPAPDHARDKDGVGMPPDGEPPETSEGAP
jgi:oligopeptide transport system substrate-binding protein